MRHRSPWFPVVPVVPGTAELAGATELAVPEGDRASGHHQHSLGVAGDRFPCDGDQSEAYAHVWWWGRPHRGADPYDPQRKGRRCRVLCQGRGSGPRNVAVLLEGDDEPVCVPRWAVRRAR